MWHVREPYGDSVCTSKLTLTCSVHHTKTLTIHGERNFQGFSSISEIWNIGASTSGTWTAARPEGARAAGFCLLNTGRTVSRSTFGAS